MVSYASVTPGQMELSPMRVKYNSVDLGGTLGNVVITTEFEKSAIKADQMGSTELDKRVSGLKVVIATEIAEVSLKDNWKVVFPNATLIDAGGGSKAMYFVSKIGESDLSLAKQLLLHPLSRADADLTGDFLFYKAVASAKSAITFSPTEQGKSKIS